MDVIRAALRPRRPWTSTVEAHALAFAGGCAAAHAADAGAAGPWLAGATALVVVALRAASRRPAVASACLLGAVAALGGAWLVVRLTAFAPDHLATRVIDDRVLVRVDGVALEGPEDVPPPRDPPGCFLGYEPGARFRVRVVALADRHGRRRPASGEVTVHVDEVLPPFPPGTAVHAIGILRGPRAPRNPGSFDGRFHARLRGRAADLFVRSRAHLAVQPASPVLRHAWSRWRDRLRAHVDRSLRAVLPRPPHPGRDALLEAVLLGRRADGADDLHDAFRRVGVAHLLAVSGLHLGVLVALVAVGLRQLGRPRAAGVAIIVLVLLYLAVVEVRVPVLRAGALALAAATAAVLGRRLRTTGLVALPALALLVRQPGDVATAGFQLSFGVVLALVTLTPHVHRRWFPPRPGPGPRAETFAAALGRGARASLVAAVVAWLVATPLVLRHFGLLSPFAIPATLLGTPLVAAMLGLGFAGIVLAAAVPPVAGLLGDGAALAAEGLLLLVTTVDALPGAAVALPPPALAWCAAALATAIAWALAPTRRVRRPVLAAGAVLAGLLIAHARAALDPAALRVDMLDVGDGTCILVRSGGRAMLFDAGSLSDPDVADRVIVPALRELGVRRLDAILVSHPNVDHYGAIPAIADALPVGRVLLTAATVAAASAEPDGAEAWLLAELGGRGLPVTARAAGDRGRLGDADVTWLHPAPGDRFGADNDASMVVAIDAAGRRLLLTGDVGPDGIARLEARHPDLRADVVELPHHGSANPEARRLLAGLAPAVVLQSTGAARWRRNRWTALDRRSERLVTARDGACSVSIDDAGRITTRRFLAPRSSRRVAPP